MGLWAKRPFSNGPQHGVCAPGTHHCADQTTTGMRAPLHPTLCRHTPSMPGKKVPYHRPQWAQYPQHLKQKVVSEALDTLHNSTTPSNRKRGGGGWHKALVVGSVSLWRRLLAEREGGGGGRGALEGKGPQRRLSELPPALNRFAGFLSPSRDPNALMPHEGKSHERRQPLVAVHLGRISVGAHRCGM